MAAALCGCLLASPALASDPKWALCGPGLYFPDRPSTEVEPSVPGSIYLSADEAELFQTGTSVLRGDVQVVDESRQLQADAVEVTQPDDVLDARGNIRYWEDGIYVSGDAAHADRPADTVSISDADYVLLDGHAHGEAQRVTMTGRDLITVDDATYTTCNPEDAAWRLDASEIELDRNTEFGTARNVLVKFKGVPVFYSPWMTFPLTDRRKTGFLTPSFGVSGDTGFEVRVPYYWNIAPHQDATFAARAMTDRGVLLEGEYRYLTERGFGQLGLEYLPHDSQRGEGRAALSLQHDGSFAPRWNTDINVDWVSDREYFEELGTNLEITSRQFLQRRGDLTYTGDHWYGLARIEDYQSIDRTIEGSSRPYKRLPQLYFSTATPWRNRRLNSGLSSELVHFDRDASVTGVRFDLRPTLSFPMRTASTFLTPRVTAQYTSYFLDSAAPGVNDRPSRLLPIFSADGGIYLDRDVRLGQENYTQTLEPRLFYLFVPFDDQDDLPVFDTGRYTFSFAQLFREDRFSGADRIGDANQLTVALTSRLLAPKTGEEVLRASVGQIFYLRDRRVQLSPDTADETSGTSDLVGEISAKLLGDWRLTAGLQWNIDERRSDRNTIRLRYQPDDQRVVNLEYRFVRDAVEQTDFSFRWPFRNNWGFVGRWNFSLPQSRTLEAAGGIEYDSCCWAARAVVRRFLRNSQGDFDNAIFLQLELKGLSGIGRSAAEFVSRSVPGYRNTF